MKQKITPEATPESVIKTDCNVFIDRAISMLKDIEVYDFYTAQYNGIRSLLQYAKESHTAAAQATPVKRDGNFTLEDMLKAIQYGKTIDPHDNLLYGKEYTEFMQSLTPAIEKSNEAGLRSKEEILGDITGIGEDLLVGNNLGILCVSPNEAFKAMEEYKNQPTPERTFTLDEMLAYGRALGSNEIRSDEHYFRKVYGIEIKK